MLRKTLIAGAAAVGLVAVSGIAGATPASAGTYLCGPWNGWCTFFAPKHGWHGGHRYRHGYHHYGWKGGKHNHQAYKGGGYKHYR